MDPSAITWVSLECDTLVNLDGAIASFLYAIALQSGDDAPPAGGLLYEEFAGIRDHQLLLPFRPYKRILSETLRVWCEQCGYPWSDRFSEAIALTARSAQPYPDAAPALRKARAGGLSLVLLADSDHDLICHSLNHLRIEFEEVIVSEDIEIYKPAAQRLAHVAERTGAQAGEMLYVCANEHVDLPPARQRGWTTACINRLVVAPAPGSARPEHTWSDLRGIEALLGEPGDPVDR